MTRSPSVRAHAGAGPGARRETISICQEHTSGINGRITRGGNVLAGCAAYSDNAAVRSNLDVVHRPTAGWPLSNPVARYQQINATGIKSCIRSGLASVINRKLTKTLRVCL